jgi:hypothetical protein
MEYIHRFHCTFIAATEPQYRISVNVLITWENRMSHAFMYFNDFTLYLMWERALITCLEYFIVNLTLYLFFVIFCKQWHDSSHTRMSVCSSWYILRQLELIKVVPDKIIKIFLLIMHVSLEMINLYKDWFKMIMVRFLNFKLIN